MSLNGFESVVQSVVDIVKEARAILFITGAGISADSGLPTYRGISGLYNNRATDEGVSIETALSGSMFRSNPALTWKYIYQIEETCRGKSYNRGHEVIARMESVVDRVCVLTQNVDGFHHKANSSNVIDIHGNLHDLYCLSCDYQETVPDYSELLIPPKCPKCGGTVRPDVVLFEEMLSIEKIERLTDELRKGFDMVFSVGTTSVFQYIAQPVLAAAYAGIPTVEINPSRTTVTDECMFVIPETAALTLDAIWSLLNQ